jgi:hypothetical protein
VQPITATLGPDFTLLQIKNEWIKENQLSVGGSRFSVCS